MRPCVSSILGWAWAVRAAVQAGNAASDSDGQNVRNVAIIGAGAAGASAAYHLHRYAEEEGLLVNITMFEKTDRIGGRTLTVNAHDSPLEPVEVGASIFVTVNHIMYNATQRFGLGLGAMKRDAARGDRTAIWDGRPALDGGFVYESIEGEGRWREAARLAWRYGTSPYFAVRLVKRTVGDFLRLYEEPWFPFRSLTERVYELGLQGVTSVTGEQYLRDNKINPDFSRHIIQAATRVNYASNLAFIHGLEAMVSFSTDGAVAVQGGNWQIFDNMVRNSGAALHVNTSVTSISFAEKKSTGTESTKPKYIISAKDTSSSSSSSTPSETWSTFFDDVIIASPWQFSAIKAADGVLHDTIDEVPYTKLHVTLFSSPFALSPAYFGLAPGSEAAPSNVYTTLREDEEPQQGAEGVGSTGFYSISTLRRVVNPKTQGREYVYKVFSPEAVTPGFLADILGAQVPDTFVPEAAEASASKDKAGNDENNGQPSSVDTISWFHAHEFWSYPVELPRVTFQDPVVGAGVYYTSGVESFISTMETSALMGMNVARLIADDAAGVERGGAVGGEGGAAGKGHDEPGEL